MMVKSTILFFWGQNWKGDIYLQTHIYIYVYRCNDMFIYTYVSVCIYIYIIANIHYYRNGIL